MGDIAEFWRREIGRNPFVLAAVAAFVISTAMNAHTGFVLGNGSWAVAAMLTAIALLTTYAGTYAFLAPMTWRSGVLILMLPLGLAVDQLAVWQTMGVQFADGQVARDRQATAGDTLAETVARKRAELAAIAEREPVEALAAQAALECRIVSRSHPDGRGPKCTVLMSRKAAAETKRGLEAEIPTLVAKLEKRPPVAAGAPQFATPMTILNGASAAMWGEDARQFSAADILFGVQILIGAMISILANLGFWLFGVGVSASPGAATQAAATDGQTFDPSLLPAPVRLAALASPEAGPAVTITPPSSGSGNGATNIINVSAAAPERRRLPAHTAARLRAVS